MYDLSQYSIYHGVAEDNRITEETEIGIRLVNRNKCYWALQKVLSVNF